MLPLLRYVSPLFAALLLLVGTACVSHVSLDVLQPAAVMVPAHIQTVGVVDRSRVGTVGQGMLGALEGALTGEAVGADATGRQEAVRGAVETLRASPRFEAVQISVDPSGAQSSLFDQQLNWKVAQRLCKQSGCEALVALEAFDSDSHIHHEVQIVEEENDDGRVIKRQVHDVERETNVRVAWRLYDVKERRILDDARDMNVARTWSERADSEQKARSQLPSQYDTVRLLGYDNGVMYGARIAPSWIRVSRAYYGRGSPDLKLAKNYVKAGDWEGATEIWLRATESPDPKERGRAAFNLALAAEVNGYLDRAVEWAREAAVTLANNRSRNYVRTLEQRRADAQRLQEQMAPESTELY